MSQTPGPVAFETFDWKVDHFITPRVYQFLYLVVIIATALTVGVGEFYVTRYVDMAFGLKVLAGLGLLLAGLVFVLLVRMSYELTLVFFRIERHTATTAEAAEVRVTTVEAPRLDVLAPHTDVQG